jgi:hypothetical protein
VKYFFIPNVIHLQDKNSYKNFKFYESYYDARYEAIKFTIDLIKNNINERRTNNI